MNYIFVFWLLLCYGSRPGQHCTHRKEDCRRKDSCGCERKRETEKERAGDCDREGCSCQRGRCDTPVATPLYPNVRTETRGCEEHGS